MHKHRLCFTLRTKIRTLLLLEKSWIFGDPNKKKKKKIFKFNIIFFFFFFFFNFFFFFFFLLPPLPPPRSGVQKVCKNVQS